MNESLRVTWQCKPFGSLRPIELLRLLSLRSAVFVVEQNCPYRDPDHKDEYALHVMGWAGDELVACARILPAGVSYDEVSIGRVATAQEVRGTGTGKRLMEKTMQYIRDTFGEVDVHISAQSYLKKFYEGYGFVQTGDEYLEDDIPHIGMIYRAANSPAKHS